MSLAATLGKHKGVLIAGGVGVVGAIAFAAYTRRGQPAAAPQYAVPNVGGFVQSGGGFGIVGGGTVTGVGSGSGAGGAGGSTTAAASDLLTVAAPGAVFDPKAGTFQLFGTPGSTHWGPGASAQQFVAPSFAAPISATVIPAWAARVVPGYGRRTA